ncbi:unnamed protein product [Rhizopus stolonifer]
MNASKTLVVDNGTGFVKCGYAGSNFPEHVFSSVVGRPILRAEEQVGNLQVKDIMVGDEAAQLRNIFKCPILWKTASFVTGKICVIYGTIHLTKN